MEHTIAAEAIYCKRVALSTGTLIGAVQIDTIMLTATSIIHTLVDIYNIIDSKTHDHKILWPCHGYNSSLYSSLILRFTTALKAITIKAIARQTGTLKRPYTVATVVLTTTIVSLALINI